MAAFLVYVNGFPFFTGRFDVKPVTISLMNGLFQITLMAETVAMEAAGESFEGKLAVAYVIHNRAKRSKGSHSDVVLKPFQFSCWNTDSPTRMNLDMIPERTWAECLVATLQAMYELVADPTNGAVYYLNEETVIKSAGKLPGWWNIDGSEADEIKIGNHTFRPPKITREV